MGTPLYMPPENLKRKKAAKTMDIYSLGVVSYELFLGVRPFDAPDFHLLIQKILHDYPIRPSVINPDFPCELETILARMLKKAPQQRYQNAAEIIDDLDGFVKANRRTGLFDRLRGLTLFSRNWK
jgi:serine/threonine-protein kinase